MVDADDGADGGESDGERPLLYDRISFCRLVSRRSERRYTKVQSTHTTIKYTHTTIKYTHTTIKYTHTFDNHSHRAGVPRLELAPTMGSLPPPSTLTT